VTSSGAIAAATMRAAVAYDYGPPENVRVANLPVPALGSHDLLVRVSAAAVNFPDLLLVSGEYQIKVPMPFVPGSDLAGVVSAVGAAVTDFKTGDRVVGTTTGGAFAEYAVLPEQAAQHLPDSVDAASGAAFGVVYTTAYHALRSVAAVQPGERLVVLGAGSGVGLAALDLGVLFGAEVIAVATGRAKLDLCRTRGASATIDLAIDDVRARLRKGRTDVVVDMIGGAATEPALRSLRPGGRLVTVGFASGEIPRIPLNLVLLKGISILGLELRTFVERFPERTADGRRELLEHLAAGRIRPYIGARFPLDETAAAMRLVADRAALGKVVIDVD
jgi:NADPH2:quinone reductase